MVSSIRLTPVASVAHIIGDGTLVAFDVGPDGVVFIVVAAKPSPFRAIQGAIFPRTVLSRPQAYRVIGLDKAQIVLDVTIPREPFSIHHAQPVGDELLLACARSHFRGPQDFEKNGRVYSRSGTFKREILLGDGIQAVQATRNGTIWTSFFDEGVFGNFGWEKPVGASGLVAWDADGNKHYAFEPAAGLESICDCYALNVQSEDDVWLYYYTEFPLVRLHRREVVSVWQMPVSGSNAFAISGEYALFRGGYNKQDTYELLNLGTPGKATAVRTLELLDSDGNKLVADRVEGRGDAIHFLCGGHLYQVDVQTVLAA